MYSTSDGLVYVHESTHLMLRGNMHSQHRAGFIDRVLLKVQKLNHMSVQAQSYTIPSPTAVKSVYFLYSLKD